MNPTNAATIVPGRSTECDRGSASALARPRSCSRFVWPALVLIAVFAIASLAFHFSAADAVLAPTLLTEFPVLGTVALWSREGALIAVGLLAGMLQGRGLGRRSADTLFDAGLRHAHKLAAVGQVASGFAHDINNLLTVIMGNLALLEREGVADPDSEGWIRVARRAAENACNLTARLLACSCCREPVSRTLRVNDIVNETMVTLPGLLGEAVTVETLLSEGLEPVRIDPHELEAAILNLAANARDAMPGGGKLTIRTATVGLNGRDVAHGTGSKKTQRSHVMLAISDSGEGMARDVLKHAKEPFFTTKAAGKGTGLGLSMVSRFVEHSGGSMRIQSERGRGTTVALFFAPSNTRSGLVPTSGGRSAAPTPVTCANERYRFFELNRTPLAGRADTVLNQRGGG